jgi:UDP-2,3-diacylglucosamine pyrophosphatase LpxH
VAEGRERGRRALPPIRSLGSFVRRIGGRLSARLPGAPLRPVTIRPTGEGTPPLTEADIRPGVRRLVVSDLHFGQADRADDFTADAELAAFVRDYAAAEPTELVLGGDTFEFLQVRLPAGQDDEWSGDAAAARLKIILAAHPEPVSALRTFLRRPGCQLTVIIGNHDFELHYAAAKRVLREALDLPENDERLRFGTSYEGGGMLFVHGNQFDSWNRFVYFDGICEPFEVVRGTRIVKEIINDLENHPLAQATLIDNVKPISAFVWYLLSVPRLRDPQVRRFVATSLAKAGRMFARTPRYALAPAISPPPPPAGRWRRLRRDGALGLAVVRRAARRAIRRESRSVAAHIRSEAGDQLQREVRAFRSSTLRAVRALARQPEHRERALFVCGHTHLAQVVALSERQTYVNTGTWTEVVLDLKTGLRQEQRFPFLEVTYPDGPDAPRGRLLVWLGAEAAPQPWIDEHPGARARGQQVTR